MQRVTERGGRERLVQQEREARAEADRSRAHFELLASVSERLAASLDPEVTVQTVADVVVPAFADWYDKLDKKAAAINPFYAPLSPIPPDVLALIPFAGLVLVLYLTGRERILARKR